MSERGVWVSGRIYCAQCIQGFRDFLKETEAGPLEPPETRKYWSGGEFAPGAFVGTCSGLYIGEEADTWRYDLSEKLEARLCKDHLLQVSVLCDDRAFSVILELQGRR